MQREEERRGEEIRRVNVYRGAKRRREEKRKMIKGGNRITRRNE